MRKLHVGITIAGITFVFSLLTVTVTQIAAKRFSADANVGVIPVIPISSASIPRFTPTFRACGTGYMQGYATDNGQGLAEGVQWDPNPKVTRREVAKLVREAKRVIERQSRFGFGNGHVGDRIVLENKPSDSKAGSITILYYDHSDYYKFIDAPTLELAEDFEHFLISINFASPI
jgi:hypothetical protein